MTTTTQHVCGECPKRGNVDPRCAVCAEVLSPCKELQELLAAVEELGELSLRGYGADGRYSSNDIARKRYNAALKAWLGVKK